MKFHELVTDSKANRKRVGRGISAGGGKTAGRGTKGQSSRTGGKVRPGFEGGQNPLSQRLPKIRGFRSRRTPMTAIQTEQLEKLGKAKVTNVVLAEAGLLKSEFEPYKVILKGEIKKSVAVSAQATTDGAKAAIEKAGGSVTIVKVTMRTKRVKTED